MRCVFADKNFGTNKPVMVTGLALDGTGGGQLYAGGSDNVTANVMAAGIDCERDHGGFQGV